MMKKRLTHHTALVLIASAAWLIQSPVNAQVSDVAPVIKDIKAYCLDFNWGEKGQFAEPGAWKDADPAAHVAWYKSMGANVIQTFCVSTNGYAWYKNGVVPEQPGLKHDFLRDVVKLGHKEGMVVVGYFCIGSNTRWGKENPDLSYGTPSTYHIPYTDEYLAYLSTAITDAVKTTGVDGFMIDWLWQPKRQSTNGKWIDAEKKLYTQLMGEAFPGEDQLKENSAKYTAYSRKVIDRCWKTIRKAAKDANPACIIWLTTNKIKHPHLVDSDIYREVDWILNEAGSVKEIVQIKPMVGKDTRLITCFADWNGQDASIVVPEALAAGVGLYGFAKPDGKDGLVNLNKILPKQLSELTGNIRNIGVLARAYRGKSIDSEWVNGDFVEPAVRPPFRIEFKDRPKGWNDTGRVTIDGDQASIVIQTPYQTGRAQLTRNGVMWPSRILVQLNRRSAEQPGPTHFRIANGMIGVSVTQLGETQVVAGKMQGGLDLNKVWEAQGFLNGGKPESPIQLDGVEARTTDKVIEIVVPAKLLESNPETLVFEWCNGGKDALDRFFMKQILLIITAVATHLAGACFGAEVYDVVVYGGTPSGIAAAIAAAREGCSVVLLEQTKHVGGMSTSGLNRDEVEHMDRRTMGGLSEKFLNEAARRSVTPMKPEGYITPGQREWQSHVAEQVFLEMLDTAKVTVRFEQLLQGVSKEAGNIMTLTVRCGTIYKAKVFIDATYEGDLMAAAGVSYALGREARDTYSESLGGVRYLDEKIKGSPYDEDGKLLPGIMLGPPPPEFSASPHPICYNIRLNLSKRAENSVPIEKPVGYDPKQYELLARSLSSGWLKKPGQVLGFYGMPSGKMECNNSQYSIVSMSMPGEQTAWAEASFEEREAIHKKYRDYTHGLLWFLKSDPRVPQNIRDEMATYGFCKDEWADNGHWPYYLYIRAARRMKGDFIMTQQDITTNRDKKDVIHIGSHFIDSHHVARYAVDKDHFINEGRIWEKGKNFDIPYKAITPKARECRNLLVPVCVSSSAVAFCAIRLEPTWMHLGEVSGMAASLAIRDKVDVQKIDIKELQEKIVKTGIPLEVSESEKDAADTSEAWRIDTTDEWQAAAAKSENLEIKDGMATPTAEMATFTSVVKKFDTKRTFGKMTLSQSPAWQNWEHIGKVGPANLEDAPVFLVKGPGDYWLFGLYGPYLGEGIKHGKNADIKGLWKDFQAKPATLTGFDVPLTTTPYPNQYDAPGGLKPELGGYHAWQSKDMVNWVHHGPVTETVSRWVTTAEQVNGKTHIYYDYPNDQDPHLFIDEDLTDGIPGKNMGLAFKNPTDGSDCSFIRDLNGSFHVIYENWSPINAKAHSWDSPLAGHAVSTDGIKDFKILPPAVDQRTKPTGKKGTYEHPHWTKEDPTNWHSDVAEYEIHEPEQNAFGDWAAISVGGQHYLFCDYHPAGEKIRIGWFTSESIDKPFTFCGEIGKGHPDPDIGFAEGRFYLINQTASDYVSPGPWVESVEVRAGVDTTGDGKIDTWTEWKEIKETYDSIKGFSKQIKKTPAEIDLSGLPAAQGFGFELRLRDTTGNSSKPILDQIHVSMK